MLTTEQPTSNAATANGVRAQADAFHTIHALRVDLVTGDAVAAMTAAARVLAAKAIRAEARRAIECATGLRDRLDRRAYTNLDHAIVIRDLVKGAQVEAHAYQRAALLALGVNPTPVAPADYADLLDVLGD